MFKTEDLPSDLHLMFRRKEQKKKKKKTSRAAQGGGLHFKAAQLRRFGLP